MGKKHPIGISVKLTRDVLDTYLDEEARQDGRLMFRIRIQGRQLRRTDDTIFEGIAGWIRPETKMGKDNIAYVSGITVYPKIMWSPQLIKRKGQEWYELVRLGTGTEMTSVEWKLSSECLWAKRITPSSIVIREMWWGLLPQYRINLFILPHFLK